MKAVLAPQFAPTEKFCNCVRKRAALSPILSTRTIGQKRAFSHICFLVRVNWTLFCFNSWYNLLWQVWSRSGADGDDRTDTPERRWSWCGPKQTLSGSFMAVKRSDLHPIQLSGVLSKFELNSSCSQVCFAFWYVAEYACRSILQQQARESTDVPLIQSTERSSCIYFLAPFPDEYDQYDHSEHSFVVSSDAIWFFWTFLCLKRNETQGKTLKVYILINWFRTEKSHYPLVVDLTWVDSGD